MLQPPPRPSGGLFGGGPPPDPNRTQQELTLQGSLLGGYDDNLSSPGGGEALGPHPSGYIGFGDATLRYWVGKDARSMEVSGRAYMNTYRNVGVGPSYGGEQRLRVRTTLGRRTRVEVRAKPALYAVFFLGLFGATQRDVGAENPDRNPTNALTESGSWATDASASLSRQWTRATSMDVGYTFSKQTFVNGVGADSRTQVGSIGLDQSDQSDGRRSAPHTTVPTASSFSGMGACSRT